MKNYEVRHQMTDHVQVDYVSSVEEVVALIQQHSSEGTLVSVRKLPAFSPTTRA